VEGNLEINAERMCDCSLERKPVGMFYWVRAADAKEVGVGNPAEETYCRPNKMTVRAPSAFCQLRFGKFLENFFLVST
jgi:hypothetical protein